MSKSISEIQREIVEEFQGFENWEEKFEYLIELGDELQTYPEEKRKEEYLVPGCQSRVWIYPTLQEDTLYFVADSDTAITKGLVSILVKVFSGQKAKDVAGADMSFLEEIGLQKFLSISRRNGLNSMIKKIQAFG